MAMKRIMPKIRQWDALSGLRVDKFVANSSIVKKRINKVYRRDAAVIYHPVNTDFFVPNDRDPEDFYLILTRFIPYKKIDLAIEACNELKKNLIILGTGPQEKELKRIAGPTITFTGRLSDEESRDYYQRCKAFLFPGYEDFGITPVEAQACGRPVIAYGKGGALDSVINGKTGIFFPEQTVQSLIEAIEEFEKTDFDPVKIRKHAENFSNDNFITKIKKFIEENK